MTPQEIQIAVAEEMGWVRLSTGTIPPDSIARQWYYMSDLPPYTTSIDAIQKACLERFENYEHTFECTLIRQSINSHRAQWQLTALDWCEAFLQTCKEIKK